MEIIKGMGGRTSAVLFKADELFNDDITNLTKRFTPTPMQVVETDIAWSEEKKNLARQLYAELFPVIAKYRPRDAAQIAAEITESTVSKVNLSVGSFAICEQKIGNGK
jgi:hypothetical protein